MSEQPLPTIPEIYRWRYSLVIRLGPVPTGKPTRQMLQSFRIHAPSFAWTATEERGASVLIGKSRSIPPQPVKIVEKMTRLSGIYLGVFDVWPTVCDAEYTAPDMETFHLVATTHEEREV